MLSPVIYLMMNGLFFTLRLSGGGGSFPRPLKAAEEKMYLERCAQGDLEARLAALELACETLAGYGGKVRLHAPLLYEGMSTALDNYCDYIHHSGEAGKWILGNLCGEKFLLRAGDVEKTLADWRDFVVHYDYEALWDQAFWDQWYEDHDAPPDWYEG